MTRWWKQLVLALAMVALVCGVADAWILTVYNPPQYWSQCDAWFWSSTPVEAREADAGSWSTSPSVNTGDDIKVRYTGLFMVEEGHETNFYVYVYWTPPGGSQSAKFLDFFLFQTSNGIFEDVGPTGSINVGTNSGTGTLLVRIQMEDDGGSRVTVAESSISVTVNMPSGC